MRSQAEGGIQRRRRRSRAGEGVSTKLRAFLGFPAREVSRGREAANRKSGCNKERGGRGARTSGAPGGHGRWRADPANAPHLLLLLRWRLWAQRDRLGHGVVPCVLSAREGAAAQRRPLGPPKRILSPGRDSHSSLSESFPSPSRNAADHVGRRAGFRSQGLTERLGVLHVGPRRGVEHPCYLSLVALSRLGCG